MFIDDYLAALVDVLDKLPREPIMAAIDVLKQARLEGRRVFVFGNGGSAATASHMVCDLGKNTARNDLPRVAVIGLNDNIAALSAYANDECYENVFARQLQTLARQGDIVIAISSSGNSPNVLRALEAAQGMGLQTIGLTGYAGGTLKDLVEICVIVPSNNVQYIEDMHLVINHLFARALREQNPA